MYPPGTFSAILCRVVSDFCAELCQRKFLPMCAQSCVRELCRRKVSGDAHQKVLCAWTLSDMCAESFRHVCAQICANCTCPELCADCHMCKMSKMAQKWRKMTKIDNLAKMSQNGPKWPKMAENVPGGYMTGHRPPAISYTGWQKLPEYALIRIAAGPKVADLPLCAHVQKSPISAPRPDGKSRRFAHVQKSPLFGVHMCAKSPLFRSTPQNICASCVRTRRHSAHKTFCGTKVFRRAAHHSVMSLCPWRKCAVSGCAHILQMCTHSAHMCWKYPSGLRAHRVRVHSRAHTVHKCAQPKHTVHIRAHIMFIGKSRLREDHQIFVHNKKYLL